MPNSFTEPSPASGRTCRGPDREAAADLPRAVVGLTDICARAYIRQQLGDHLMTFAVPLQMFQEMEGNVEGSFLERPVWEKLAEGKPGPSLRCEVVSIK